MDTDFIHLKASIVAPIIVRLPDAPLPHTNTKRQFSLLFVRRYPQFPHRLLDGWSARPAISKNSALNSSQFQKMRSYILLNQTLEDEN